MAKAGRRGPRISGYPGPEDNYAVDPFAVGVNVSIRTNNPGALKVAGRSRICSPFGVIADFDELTPGHQENIHDQYRDKAFRKLSGGSEVAGRNLYPNYIANPHFRNRRRHGFFGCLITDVP